MLSGRFRRGGGGGTDEEDVTDLERATRGEEEEPFHMSRAQMNTASRFSERAEVGTDIYVVVRVSRIGMPEPSYMVYADPHRALFYGLLQYVNDVFLQRNMEFQV